MTPSARTTSFEMSRSIARWFGCLLFSALFFSLLFSFAGPLMLLIIFQTTMSYALPVWFLYVPFLKRLENGKPWRMTLFLISGMVAAPACLVLYGLILQFRGGHKVWAGDGIDLGLAPVIISAFIVGGLTTGSYVFILKVVQLRSLFIHTKDA